MKKLIGLTVVLALVAPLQAAATTTTYQVFALGNSTSGGVGVQVPVFAGNSFSVFANTNDLWNAGPLPRWSNANGLTGPLVATGVADVSGDFPGPINTVIGSNFGLRTQGGLTAPFGTLVGEWGNSLGTYFAIGTAFAGTAPVGASTLRLSYFDSNNFDNTGSIMATVTAVPEPETYAMFMAGLGLMGFMARRRKTS